MKETKAILKRAFEYPYDLPKDSYLFVDGKTLPFNEENISFLKQQYGAECVDLKKRIPVLACGSNSAPLQL